MEVIARSPFAELDAGGHFHRDNALGRAFHRGAASFREVSTNDSLHVCVLPDNKVSVHVDRVSPLLVKEDRALGYSVSRAILHNLAAAGEAILGFLLRRPSRPACELECELVWVPDEVAQDLIERSPEAEVRAG